MKKLILIFGLLVSCLSFAASGSGNVSTIFKQGGGMSSGIANGPIVSEMGTKPFNVATMGTICLNTWGGATTNNYVSFVVMGKQGSGFIGQGTTGSFYQVSAGKTAVAYGYKQLSGGVVNSQLFHFGYSTSVPAGLNTATVPTGPFYYSGTVNKYGLYNSSVSGVWAFTPITLTFPAGSFPWIQTETNGQLYTICMDIEEI